MQRKLMDFFGNCMAYLSRKINVNLGKVDGHVMFNQLYSIFLIFE